MQEILNEMAKLNVSPETIDREIELVQLELLSLFEKGDINESIG